MNSRCSAWCAPPARVTPPLIILMISLYGVCIGLAKLVQPLWAADASGG